MRSAELLSVKMNPTLSVQHLRIIDDSHLVSPTRSEPHDRALKKQAGSGCLGLITFFSHEEIYKAGSRIWP